MDQQVQQIVSNIDFSIMDHWQRLLPVFILSFIGAIASVIMLQKDEVTFKKIIQSFFPATFAGSVMYFFLFSSTYIAESTKLALSSVAAYGASDVLPRLTSLCCKFIEGMNNFNFNNNKSSAIVNKTPTDGE